MSQNKTLTLATPFQSKTEHNVQGWERAGSLATGVVMVGKGLRRGGFFGLIQIAIVISSAAIITGVGLLAVTGGLLGLAGIALMALAQFAPTALF